MRKRSLLFAIFLVLTASVPASAQPSDAMIDLGSHSLQMHREGQGTPPVVIDTGIADRLDKWRALQERMALATQVIAYNRAGYGRSEPGPLPRDCGREADELKALLDRASVPGPYVLVGHSLGALNVQAFAAKYPKDVAGMVLLDPPPLSFIRGEEYTSLRAMADRMTAEWQALADAGAEANDAEARARATFFRTIASEHRELFGESARRLSEIPSFGDIPLLVMAAGKPNPHFGDIAEEYQAYWVEQNRSLSRKSTKGKFVLAKESTHLLYQDVPDLVMERILLLVFQARGEK